MNNVFRLINADKTMNHPRSWCQSLRIMVLPRTGIRVLAAVALLLGMGALARADEAVGPYPAGAPVVDVTQPPYNAPNDGIADATAAIRSAMSDHVGRHTILYFPAGTYLLSDTLSFREFQMPQPEGGRGRYATFEGDGPDQTIFRLADNSPGFNDLEDLQAVIITGGGYAEGRNNTTFGVYLRNFAVEIGAGNPGAMAIDYLGHNWNAIRNVVLRDLDNSAHTGLYMGRHWPGPSLISNLRVEGFRRGVFVRHYNYSVTFRDLELIGQRQCGMWNGGNAAFIHGLRSRNVVPAIIAGSANGGFTVLVEAVMEGGDGSNDAIRMLSSQAIYYGNALYGRNVRAEGYARAVEGIDGLAHDNLALGLCPNMPRTRIDFLDADHAAGDPGPPLNLPIETTPELPDIPPEQWANVMDFGAIPNETLFTLDFDAVRTTDAVRIVSHGNTDNDWLHVSDVQVFGRSEEGRFYHPIAAAAASENEDSAGQAVDGNPRTAWHAESLGATLTLNLTGPQSVRGIEIGSRFRGEPGRENKVTLQVRDRSGQWIDVGGERRFPDRPYERHCAADAVEAAMNSGARAVWFPMEFKRFDPNSAQFGSRWHFSRSVRIPANIELIHGFNSNMMTFRGGDFKNDDDPMTPIFIADDGPTLFVKHTLVESAWSQVKRFALIGTRNQRNLVVQDSAGGIVTLGEGPNNRVFLENVSGWENGAFQFVHPTRVWAWQLNPETPWDTSLVNNGGQVWIFGMKTERPGILTQTENGGATEVLGGHFYLTQPPAQRFRNMLPWDLPVHVVQSGGRASFSFQTIRHRDLTNRTVLVQRDDRDDFLRSQAPSVVNRGNAQVVLYNAFTDEKK